MEQERKEVVRLERSILTFYSIFNVTLFLFAEQLEWGSIVSLLYLLSIFVMWFISLNGYFDRKVRSFLYVCIMQISLLLLVANGAEYESVLFLIICLGILSGLFGEKNLIILTSFVALLLTVYEVYRNFSEYVNYDESRSLLLVEVINLFLIEYAIYFWVKKREDTKRYMEESIEELHIAEQSKTDFLCNVSHELRTPINSIVGISEIASKETELERIREEIDQMQLAGKRLLSVVSDVLDFSELQSGKVEVLEEAYYISSMIQDIIKMSYSFKEEKKIEILFNIDGNIPKGLIGDEKKIRRVILNLVNNAVKFTQNGYVLIKVTSRKEGYGVNLCFEIKDTGIGMSQEDQEKLFNSFTQIDGSRKRAVGGMGLGLSISKMLVYQMGGILSVKSKEGKGTTFQVVIPQKIADENPISVVKNKDKINVAVYIDMEQFELELIRGAYASVITECVGSLQVKYHFFKNFLDLKRRLEKKEFTHLYMSMNSYQNNQPYFDAISSNIQILVVREPAMGRVLANKDLIEISKPFNLLSLVEALNQGRDMLDSNETDSDTQFVAPEACVLVVDDNMMNLLVAKRLLESYQIQVDTALSGMEALTMVQNREYDIVFMDHMMPEMDGVETLHAIRKLVGTYYSYVPVIALTANAVAGSREMFLKEGFTDFVEKPIDISTLERKCRKYISQDKIGKLQSKSLITEKEQREDDSLEVSKESLVKKNDEMVIPGISTKDGLVYCRDEEIYKEMLSQCAMSGLDVIYRIKELFTSQKWKDYTIAVHAAKSATKTVGAIALSESCKELELLGKEYDALENKESEEALMLIEKIKNKHPKMIQCYQEIVGNISEYFGICPVCTLKDKKVFESTPEYERLMQGLEDAAYDFDGDRMKELLASIENKEMKESLAGIYQKIECSDLISAAEAFRKLFA